MEKNRAIDYATPAKARKQPYWLILVAAWIVSLPLANVLDHTLKRYLDGGSADGGVTMLAMFAIAPAVVVAAFVKRRWWAAAIIGGACSPLTVVGMYLLWR